MVVEVKGAHFLPTSCHHSFRYRQSQLTSDQGLLPKLLIPTFYIFFYRQSHIRSISFVILAWSDLLCVQVVEVVVEAGGIGEQGGQSSEVSVQESVKYVESLNLWSM